VKLLFVTATNTNIGKTFTTIKLIEGFAKQGIAVGVFKPIETGVTHEPEDAKLLLKTVQKYNQNFKNLKPIDITSYTFKLPAAPFCADLARTINVEKIKAKIETLKKLCDLLIIEGAGGLMVPITSNYMMIDLIEELDTMTLLVTSSRLGSINDTQLSIEALKQRSISFDWTVNLFEEKEAFRKVTQPYYDKAFPTWWSLDDGLEKFILKYK
jgi:dethiobiotin synthetase